MFISSLHNIKSKNFKKKELWKSMKVICFTFDDFGHWNERDRSKMKWRMKVELEWRPSMTGRPKIGGQPATFSLLSPPLSPSLAQPPHLWDKVEGNGHMGWPPGHLPWPAGHPLSPL
jgi:hypothetical protein